MGGWCWPICVVNHSELEPLPADDELESYRALAIPEDDEPESLFRELTLES